MKKLTSLDEIKKISGGNTELVKEFITKFIAQLSDQLLILNRNITEGNATEIKFHVHKMKSTLYYFGMLNQRELAQEIEKIIFSDIEKAKPLIKELIDSCELGIGELKLELKTL